MDLCLWRAFLSSDMWASIVSHMYDFKKSLLAPEHFPSLLRFTFNILHKFQQKICSFDQGWDPCYLITWHLGGFEKCKIEAGGGRGWSKYLSLWGGSKMLFKFAGRHDSRSQISQRSSLTSCIGKNGSSTDWKVLESYINWSFLPWLQIGVVIYRVQFCKFSLHILKEVLVRIHSF